jgi:hypothetical protein
MATWFEITFTGEPTEADFERVSKLAAEGFTSGQLTNEERRYIAHFTPEEWVRDNAVEVDAEGPQEWDCTAYARGVADYLEVCARRRHENLDDGVLDNDDVFADDPAAPEWVRAWHGPFTITVRYAKEGE